MSSKWPAISDPGNHLEVGSNTSRDADLRICDIRSHKNTNLYINIFTDYANIARTLPIVFTNSVELVVATCQNFTSF